MVSIAPISQQIWDMKYRLKDADGTVIDATIEETWKRVARSLAEVESPESRARWTEDFYSALADFQFMTGPAASSPGPAPAGASPCSIASSWARCRTICRAFSCICARRR